MELACVRLGMLARHAPRSAQAQFRIPAMDMVCACKTQRVHASILRARAFGWEVNAMIARLDTWA